MTDKINLSLDDIIKISKTTKTNKGKRGRGTAGRGRGRGSSRGRGTGRGVARGGVSQVRSKRGAGRGRGRGRQQASFTRSKSAPKDKWDHDMFSPGAAGRLGMRNSLITRSGNGKLLVTNLDFGVSDSDINELFSEFGALRRAAVHYDRSGRSLGSADVHYERRSDALKAIAQYNNVPLDGRAMQIRFVDGDAPVARVTGTAVNGGSFGKAQKSYRGSSRGRGGRGGTGRGRGGGAGRGQSRGRGRGRGRGGRGGGRGGGQQRKEVSLEELDKQLDEYISKND